MWGREMRAGLAFVIAALLIGQGFREWRRSHEKSFQDLVADLEQRDAYTRGSPVRGTGDQAPDSARGSSGPNEAAAVARTARIPREMPVGRIDPNRASAAELTRLPGIGPALAGRIVVDRDQNGAFRSPEALLRVPGIGPKTLARIRAYLSLPNAAGGDSLTGF
jgi:competence ComEA-like helix-hairpin-helix protein